MKNFILGFCLAYLFIILIGAYFEGFYHKRVEEPVEALKFLTNLVQEPGLNEWWFHVETTKDKGVITYDKDKSWGDYTLFTSIGTDKAMVMNMSGEIVYEWDIPFPPERLTYKDRAAAGRLFSDPTNRGNIYVMYFGEKAAVSEYGTIKFDRSSKILWENPNALHHTMTFLEDGRYMTFLQAARNEKHPALLQIEPPYLEDFLVVVDGKTGEYSQEISFIDAFARSEYKSVLESLHRTPADPEMREGDLFHPNTITPVPEQVSNTFPNITKNSVMLSFRNIDMIAFLDLDNKTISWALYGPWRGQHDPRFLDNGHVIMLDNQGNTGPGGRSRLLEVDLQDLSIVWEYGGSEEKPFYTGYNGMIDVLPNGNILVTETHTGRIFEVTRDKEIVWDYYVSERVEHEGEIRIPSVVSARRFTKEELGSLIVN